MPDRVGIGFIDLGIGNPGTQSSAFSSEEIQRGWLKGEGGFETHVASHIATASSSIGCVCGKCGAPRIVAFTGKRQYIEVLNASRRAAGDKPAKTVPIGIQSEVPTHAGWPFPSTTEVWVLTSTSGASALTNEARIKPYADLAAALQDVPWPLPPNAVCLHASEDASPSATEIP